MECIVCQHKEKVSNLSQLGQSKGNSEKYKNTVFDIWKCSQCDSIVTQGEVDFSEIYSDYVLAKRSLDFYAKTTYKNLLDRLKKTQINKDAKVLDFGCGQGIFLDYLKLKSYQNVHGYDPYENRFSQQSILSEKFDLVVANDVIEHVDSPIEALNQIVKATKVGGYIYVGTADADSVKDMRNLEDDRMLLHLPYHRVILTQKTLLSMGEKLNLELVASYKRSYMDTLVPFVNYRFLHELSKSLEHNMDRMFKFNMAIHFLKNPKLIFWGYFGYFFPVAYEPAVVWRKKGTSS